MGSKPLTRITVSSMGSPRELFKVRERKDGDLLISYRNYGRIKLDDGAPPFIAHTEVIKESHYSVHFSPRSKGVTLKHSMETPDRPTDWAATVMPFEEDSVFPLFVRRHAQMREPIFSVSPKTKDRVIECGYVNGRLVTLVSAVLISGKNYNLSDDFSPRLHFHSVEFREFSLHVGLGFTIFAGLRSNSTAWPELSPARHGRRALTPEERSTAKPMSSEQVLDFMHSCIDGLLATMLSDFAWRNPLYAHSLPKRLWLTPLVAKR
nr:hypothetical protein [uncultured Brevundimonas sp.]